mmetsp:Transcript_23868/g.50291  ORF Transcript_23868/g.50291 Transcript_23868/m.50291 type:complete len:306 (+) Transcript_23868:128-1045(+)
MAGPGPENPPGRHRSRSWTRHCHPRLCTEHPPRRVVQRRQHTKSVLRRRTDDARLPRQGNLPHRLREARLATALCGQRRGDHDGTGTLQHRNGHVRNGGNRCHHRREFLQGRGRKIDDLRQPGLFPAIAGSERRDIRLRRLRTVPSDHGRTGRRHRALRGPADRTPATKRCPPHEFWVHQRRVGNHAGPHGQPVAGSVSQRHAVGKTRLPHPGHATGHRGHSVDAHPEAQHYGGCDCNDTARIEFCRRCEGSRNVRYGQYTVCGRGRKHGLLRQRSSVPGQQPGRTRRERSKHAGGKGIAQHQRR